jgi:hypothetical protein
MTIQLVNTTTRLRVDDILEEQVFSVIDPPYIDAVEKWSRELQQRERRLPESNLNIEMVSKRDLDRYRPMRIPVRMPKEGARQVPHMDLLGVYIAHDSNHLRSRILVSPEKVLSACYALQGAATKTLHFERLYPALLSAVIAHEMAHLLMDPGMHKLCRCARSWRGLCTDTDKLLNAQPEKGDKWADETVPPGAIEEYLERKGGKADVLCTDLAKLTVKLELLGAGRRIVEESLANALAFKQSYEKPERRALRQFIEEQPAAYRAGLRWTGSRKQLLGTAASWRQFKADHVNPKYRKSLDSRKRVLDDLVHTLKKADGELQSFDFQKGR